MGPWSTFFALAPSHSSGHVHFKSQYSSQSSSPLPSLCPRLNDMPGVKEMKLSVFFSSSRTLVEEL